MSEASKNAIIERCVSVIRNHPNTGGGLGPLKKWLDAILEDKDRSKELRGLVKDIAKDNTLADKVCVLVERFSERKGDPWKLNLGKNEDKDAAQPKAAAKKNASGTPNTPDEGWQTAGKKNKGRRHQSAEVKPMRLHIRKGDPFLDELD